MVRSVRLANERVCLAELVANNSALLQVFSCKSKATYDDIPFQLTASPGLLREGNCLSVAITHDGILRFPTMFPAASIEIYLDRPVFHPNVDPFNGFMCLWDSYSPTYTSADALRQARRMLAWETMNLETVHLLQRDAKDWFESGRISFQLPLPHRKLIFPSYPQGRVMVKRSRLFPVE